MQAHSVRPEEIGKDVFSLYFLIKRSEYHSLLKKVDEWADYHEINYMIEWVNKE